MVLVGGRPEQERDESEFAKSRFNMAMGPERSQSLHNFSLPCLKWGAQRRIPCVRSHVEDGEGTGGNHFRDFGRRSSPMSFTPPEAERKRRSVFESSEVFRRSPSRFQPSTVAAKAEIRRRPAIGDDGDGIEAVRKKLMLDFQTEMDRMKSAVLSQGREEIVPPPTNTEAPPAAEAMPWNLRTRRAVCKEPNVTGGGGGKSQRVGEGNSSFPSAVVAMKSPARRTDVGSVDYVGVKRPRTKLSVSVSVPLSKREIEEDFIAMTGVRPPRKPKKRPRIIQKQLDTLFPGLWLTDITADMYKVNENPEPRKR